MAKVPKMRPRTKHINIKYHHFHQHVLLIHAVSTENQVADIFTKPLNGTAFKLHQFQISRW
jgi:hypothetical protein